MGGMNSLKSLYLSCHLHLVFFCRIILLRINHEDPNNFFLQEYNSWCRWYSFLSKCNNLTIANVGLRWRWHDDDELWKKRLLLLIFSYVQFFSVYMKWNTFFHWLRMLLSFVWRLGCRCDESWSTTHFLLSQAKFYSHKSVRNLTLVFTDKNVVDEDGKRIVTDNQEI